MESSQSSQLACSEELQLLHIITFLPWKQRAQVPALCRSLRTSLESSGGRVEPGSYWRFLLQRLSLEHQVYVPDIFTAVRPAPSIADTWQTLFEELFAEVLVEHKEDAEAASFKIDVAARFRPAGPNYEEDDEEKVVLPLHQKVQLVKQQLACSSKEALRLVMQKHFLGAQKQDGAGDGGIMKLCDTAVENKENVPFGPGDNDEAELERQDNFEIDEPEDEQDAKSDHAPNISAVDACCSIVGVRPDTASVLAITKQSGIREFSFDRVFPQDSKQADVYELAARRLVMRFLNGTSGSIICYGQTGSGKTHTMFGPSAFLSTGSVGLEQLGLVPRACSEVLAAVKVWRDQGLEVELGASYVELFGSEVSDLLQAGRVVGQGQEGRYAGVRATDRVGHRYVLDGHTEWAVESLEHVNGILRQGDESKRRAATAMNERSTRAHTVFVLSLVVKRTAFSSDPELPVRRSRFYFADLGGSEQLSKSKADAGLRAPVTVIGGEEHSRISWREFYAHRHRLLETLNINKGLFALKRVIEALHRRSRLAKEGVPLHQLPYVPYQDSKLTMLLAEALGGSARTLVMTTATMDRGHIVESLQTMRFGETCAQVQKQRTSDHAATLGAALEKIDDEIRCLQQEIAQKERWETRLVRREDVDTIAGAFGEGSTIVREEVVPTSVPVGAEAERERLESLIQRQAELQGLGSLSGLGKDYRAIRASATAATVDGGRGVDFRERDRFSTRTKAKEFEDEVVVADALRSFFGRAKCKEVQDVFGETPETFGKKILRRSDLPEGYVTVARALRKLWEDRTAAGTESRLFGKSMLDRCNAWRVSFQAGTTSRETELQRLLLELRET